MQNGGMASALAMNVLKSPQAALASAIFGPWQNISGLDPGHVLAPQAGPGCSSRRDAARGVFEKGELNESA